MADWRSPGSSSPWSNYQSMGPDEDVDDGQQTSSDGRGPPEAPADPQTQRFSAHASPPPLPPARPRGPDARLHIDDLRESPMPRHDLISLESNPRGPIVDNPQPVRVVFQDPQTPPLPPPRRASQSSTTAVGGSFLNQLVAGVWQPKRAASTLGPDPHDDEFQAPYDQQQTPHAQNQQRLSGMRTFEDTIPRRSLLVPSPTNFDLGRRTLDPEEHLRQPRATSPSMRNIQQFRPVAVPVGAVAAPSSSSEETVPRSTRVEAGHSRPTTTTTARPETERSRGISTTTSSSDASRATAVERAHRIFAARQVRFEDSWHADMWIYMKNAHPFIGIFGAHRWHPYKRRDRVLVLLVALLVMFLCCGVFATQKCCDVVIETPIAVVGRHLSSSVLAPAATRQQCAAFSSSCEDSDDQLPALCTEGSTCSSVSGHTGRQCVPLVAAASRTCGGGSDTLTCPTGWACDAATSKCAPSSSLVCYVPQKSSAALSFAADDSSDSEKSGGVTAIEAIFGILIQANNATAVASNTTASPKSSSGSSSSVDTPTPTSKAAVAQSISVALTKPTDGGVYSVASSVPIEWTVSALTGSEQPLKSFSVDFSADGTTFSTIATDVTATSSSSATASVFHYDWKLNNNASLLCTKCVLRACSTVGSGSVCIRSDGGETAAATNSFVVTRTASSAARKGITFRIVREILECSCGLAHASFVQFSYLIALSLPVVALLLEQLVTFYRDSKFFGLFARRDGPLTPRICSYSHNAATHVGRMVIVLILAAACISAGVQMALVNEANFYNQKGRIVLLWLAMYGLCVLLGFIYCSLLYLALFSLRWKLELAHKNHAGPRNDFRAGMERHGRRPRGGRAHPHSDYYQHQQHYPHGPLGALDEEDESRRSAAMLGAL